MTEIKTELISDPQQTPSTTYSFSKKQLVITGIVVLVIVIGLYAWRVMTVNGLNKKHEQDRVALIQQANTEREANSRQFLTLLAKPYVWALRTELMQKNIGKIDFYNTDFISEKNIVAVVVTDEKGLIISSTNKKYENKPFSSFGAPALLNGNSTVIDKTNDSLLIMVSPIMSFNSKLGTLVLQYSLKKTGLK